MRSFQDNFEVLNFSSELLYILIDQNDNNHYIGRQRDPLLDRHEASHTIIYLYMYIIVKLII